MIVHLENGLWQIRKMLIAESWIDRMDRISAKDWNGRQEKSEEAGTMNEISYPNKTIVKILTPPAKCTPDCRD
jgi:hypothetical protein